MVTKELSEAAVEFNSILDNTSQDIIRKIPAEFINFMKKIASTTYKFEYNKDKTLNEQNLKAETRGIISLVYSDYICDEKEKKEYLGKCQQYFVIKEKEAKEKYSTDNLFKNRSPKEESIENSVEMVEYKESIFIKLKNWIKNLFSFHN